MSIPKKRVRRIATSLALAGVACLLLAGRPPGKVAGRASSALAPSAFRSGTKSSGSYSGPLRGRNRFFSSLQAYAANMGISSSSPNRSPRISIVENTRATATTFAFVAQDLYIAQHDPNDPNGNMAVYANLALQQFAGKHGGRDPQTDLEYAIAVTDWVSTNLRHPAFYPEDPNAPRFYLRLAPDPEYDTFHWEPLRILNYTMQHDPSDPVNWPSPFCTQQNFAAAGILNYFGLHARIVDIEDHDGLEYYSFLYHKWVWCDSTFNEHYLRVGSDVPLGVRELNQMTLASQTDQVIPVKHGYPTSLYPENTYIYLHPHGFRQYDTVLYMNTFDGNGYWLNRMNFIDYSPDPPPTYVPLPGEIIHMEDVVGMPGFWYWPETNDPDSTDIPLDALTVAGPVQLNFSNSSFSLSLTSYLPYTVRFEEWSDATQSWSTIFTVAVPASAPQTSPLIRLSFGIGTQTPRFRAVDDVGNHTKEASFVVD